MRTIQRNIIGAFIFSNDGHRAKCQRRRLYRYVAYSRRGIDEGESEIDALVREVQEEVGLDIAGAESERIPGTHAGRSEKTLRDSGERVVVEMIFNDYIVRLPQQAADIPLMSGDDFTNARWLPITEFSVTDFAPGTTATLKKIGLLI